MNSSELISPDHNPQESLLEYALNLWTNADWSALSRMDHGSIASRQDRQQIALLVADSYSHQQDWEKSRFWFKQAICWGAAKKAPASMLIAGIHNTLGRLAALQENNSEMVSHFTESVSPAPLAGYPASSDTRIIKELAKAGLLAKGADFLQDQIAKLDVTNYQTPWLSNHVNILKNSIELLQSELVIAQRRGQLQMKGQVQESHPTSVAHSNQQWEQELQNRAASQLGQDLWVLKKCSYKRKGYFVEFGATNGIILSNTYLLEKEFGWEGLCAEPNPLFFKELKKNRLCRISTACIGGQTGEQVDFVFADVYGGMVASAGDDQHGPKRQAFQDLGETATLTTISLHDFLIENNAPRPIDYISIDTEGSEFSILERFPFDYWDVRLFTIEHNYTPQRAKIRSLLENNGYRCQEADFDDWYYRD